jgi:hypothetical protein
MPCIMRLPRSCAAPSRILAFGFEMTQFRNTSLADPTSLIGSAMEKSLAPDCLADNGQDTIPIAPVSLPHQGTSAAFALAWDNTKCFLYGRSSDRREYRRICTRPCVVNAGLLGGREESLRAAFPHSAAHRNSQVCFAQSSLLLDQVCGETNAVDDGRPGKGFRVPSNVTLGRHLAYRLANTAPSSEMVSAQAAAPRWRTRSVCLL